MINPSNWVLWSILAFPMKKQVKCLQYAQGPNYPVMPKISFSLILWNRNHQSNRNSEISGIFMIMK